MMKTRRPSCIRSYADTLRDTVESRACLKFSPKDTVPDIIDRMHAAGISAGGVVDSAGQFVGFVTEEDIVRRIFGRFEPHHGVDYIHEHKAVSHMTAWDVMILNPDTLCVDDTVEDALDLITYFGYRTMPVVDAKGKLAGIVEAEELRQHVNAKSQTLKEANGSLPPYMMQQDLGLPYEGFPQSY